LVFIEVHVINVHAQTMITIRQHNIRKTS